MYNFVRGLLQSVVLFAAVFVPLAAGTLSAQNFPDIPTVISPPDIKQDFQGVNLVSGKIVIDIPVLQIPGSPRLIFDRVQNSLPYITGRVAPGGGEGLVQSYSVHTGRGPSASFQCIDSDCFPTATSPQGATLDLSGGQENLNFVYKEEGTRVTYNFNVKGVYVFFDGQENHLNYPSSVSYPDGEVLFYTYQTFDDPESYNGGFRRYHRTHTVTTTAGYQLTISYHSGQLYTADWSKPHAVEIRNTSSGSVVARHVYDNNPNNVLQITDLEGRAYNCANCQNQFAYRSEVTFGSLQAPGEATPEMVVTQHASPIVVGSVQRNGVTWNYSYQNLRSTQGGLQPLYDSMTITRPDGAAYRYEFSAFGAPQRLSIRAMVDPLGRRSEFSFDERSRLRSVVRPEGNSEVFDYDIFGNIIRQIKKPKSGSGLSDEIVTAHYPTDDASLCSPTYTFFVSIRCFRPLWIDDARGMRTEYAYNNRGQVTTIVAPADAQGARTKTKIDYALIAGISRVVTETICTETENCTTQGLSRTEYQYWQNTGLPSRVCKIDLVTGDIVTTAYGYDEAGRRISETKPLGVAGGCTQ